ncbi:hypothetical protein BDN71DRAFT_1428217 [Pleurotus eryngii]|uniref:F-box domain-containing protein n=1 Tax=Pleurotus eryngii TaxID=5323 RepID=A0A9P6A559_PLEER|nr:hypothetical protein BDN71DRAFT_1428217 [Pleurotus eryngii]
MPSFSDLPQETVLELAKFMPTSSCLALSRTCSTLHNTLMPFLYVNVNVTSKPSQLVHPISTLELFYTKMLKNKENRRLVKTLAVSWAGRSLMKREHEMIALLIDILPNLTIFQFDDLAKAVPEDIRQHNMQGTDSTSLDLPAGRLQIHQSRYPTRDRLVLLASPSLMQLIWADMCSPLKYFADFARPLHNIKTLRLHPIHYFLCDHLDHTVLPRLENSMHPVDSSIVPYGTKLKFLRISSNLFITCDVIDKLFDDFPTLECIEWAMEYKMHTGVLGKPFYYGTRKYRDVNGFQNVQWMCPLDEEWLGNWKEDKLCPYTTLCSIQPFYGAMALLRGQVYKVMVVVEARSPNVLLYSLPPRLLQFDAVSVPRVSAEVQENLMLDTIQVHQNHHSNGVENRVHHILALPHFRYITKLGVLQRRHREKIPVGRCSLLSVDYLSNRRYSTQTACVTRKL